MATSAATLVQRCRRFLGDWPEGDVSTASISSGGTTLTVADSSIYGIGHLIQMDTEGMIVRAKPSGTTLTVYRAARGTTGASHASGATVLVRPRFLDQDYLEALNAGINATFPWIYRPVVDESLVATTSTYEYTIPNLNSVPIPYISRLQFKESADLSFRDFGSWDIIRGSTPIIKLRRPLPNGTIRIYGFGPIPTLATLAASLDSLFPVYAEDALTMFACQYLTAGGEAARTREDTGARDQRENANRTGASINVSNALFGRFQRRLMDAGLPPMPKSIKTIL